MGHEERKSTRFTAVFFTYLVNSSSASESDIPSFYQANATLLRKICVKMHATVLTFFVRLCVHARYRGKKFNKFRRLITL